MAIIFRLAWVEFGKDRSAAKLICPDLCLKLATCKLRDCCDVPYLFAPCSPLQTTWNIKKNTMASADVEMKDASAEVSIAKSKNVPIDCTIHKSLLSTQPTFCLLGRQASREACWSRSQIWNQEMECCSNVVMGYLCGHCKFFSAAMLYDVKDLSCCKCLTPCCRTFYPCIPLIINYNSVPFAEIHWTSLLLNTKPTLRPQMTMDCPLPLVTAAMYFTWIASNVGWRLEVFVRCVIKNGTLPRLNEFQDMVNWVFRIIFAVKIVGRML